MTFSERLLELIAEKKITKNKLMTDLDYNKSSVLNWTQRGNIPSGDILQTLADYFNVSVDYLLGTATKKSAIEVDNGLNEFDKIMLEKVKGFSPESQAKILDYIELLKLQRGQ